MTQNRTKKKINKTHLPVLHIILCYLGPLKGDEKEKHIIIIIIIIMYMCVYGLRLIVMTIGRALGVSDNESMMGRSVQPFFCNSRHETTTRARQQRSRRNENR